MSEQGLRFPDALSTSEAYRKKYHVPSRGNLRRGELP